MMQGRVQYIDAMKGLCMLFIVASHVGLDVLPESALSTRVLAFFLLAGMTFSSDIPARDFIRKKARRLLIPFLFFYLLSYALFYLGKWIIPGFDGMTGSKGILDVFVQDLYFNGPLWFLLSLFVVYILGYGIHRLTDNRIVRILIYCGLGAVGFSLHCLGIDLKMGIDSALTAMPFFMLGTLLAECGIPERGRDMILRAVFVVLALTLFYFFPFYADVAINYYDCSLIRLWVIGGITCTGYLVLTKLICRYLPFIGKMLAWVGYHSLYIMCVHHLVYRPFELVLDRYMSGWPLSLSVFALTLLVCLSTAPAASRYLPRS